jgi:phage/plasmid-associated DNA primase
MPAGGYAADVPPLPDDDDDILYLRTGGAPEICSLVLESLERRYGAGLVRAAEGAVWVYRDTHWHELSTRALRREFYELNGAMYPSGVSAKGDVRYSALVLYDKTINGLVNEFQHVAAGADDADDFFAPAARPVGINCSNGFVRLDGDGRATLEPHSPEHRQRSVFAGSFDPAKQLTAEDFQGSLLATLLTGCFRDDPAINEKVQALQEFAGVVVSGCSPSLKEKKSLILYGETAGNGKSQVVDLLAGLTPEYAQCSVPVDSFGDEKYVVQLRGKSLNFCDELSGNAVKSEKFKLIIDCKTTAGRDVYSSVSTFVPFAAHVFATNELPSFSGGMDPGVRRRLFPVQFCRTIPKSERIANIGQRILSEEADLLLHWAIEGAARVMQRGELEDLNCVREAVQEWAADSDPVLGWLAAAVERADPDALDGAPEPSEAYAHFKSWALAEGHKPNLLPSLKSFSTRVKATGYARTVLSGRRRLAGIRLKPVSWAVQAPGGMYH